MDKYDFERTQLEQKLEELLQREQEALRRAEQAISMLRHTEKRFTALFDSNVIGILEVNRERVLDANANFLRMTGHTRESILSGNLKWSDITPAKYARVDVMAHHRALREGAFPPYEKEFYRADSSVVPVWVGGVLLHPPPDWTCMAFVLDLSERKALEQQSHSAQKLKTLGLLSGVIAHDFNNLLTTMIGNATLALDSLPPDSPAWGPVEEVLRASKLASGLTNQLVSYSSKSESKMQLIDLSEIVREMGDLIELPLSRKVRIDWNLAPGLPPVHGESYPIQQIMMNLVINASDAFGDNAGTVRILTHCRHYSATELEAMTVGANAPADEYVAVEVQDDGCGMTEEVKARIFDPLFTTKLKGRGLGLASALGIVRNHRGAIDVRSKPGKGTTFVVLFPAAREAAEGVAPAAPAVEDLQGEGTVLVMDDEPGIRRLAETTLSRYGYRVLVAQDGDEGVEIYRREREAITLVILDLSMPVMSGAEALRHLLALNPKANVLFSSGYNASESMKRLDRYPFLQKPYTSWDLATVVKELHTVAK